MKRAGRYGARLDHDVFAERVGNAQPWGEHVVIEPGTVPIAMKFGLGFAFVSSLSATLFITGVTRAQSTTTERVSVDSSGVQGNHFSASCAISADGRFVAFESAASNLVAGDTAGHRDVFVRDRATATTERVSVATGGGQALSDSYSPSISADGRFVAFTSDAWNLVTGDVNSRSDIFVRDRVLATTERVSVATGGVQANQYSDYATISATGRFVAFQSRAWNLVPGDTNGQDDIFVRDRQSATTELVSVGSAGVQGNSFAYLPSISSDGRFVAFESPSSNLVALDTNGCSDIFVRDRQSGTTERVSLDSQGQQGNSNSYAPSISADGRFVAFYSYATNLAALDTNARPDIFVRDRQSATTERVSVDSLGAQGNADSIYPSISADGRYLAFQSAATNLVALDTNGSVDLFVHDRQLGSTERASVDSLGAQGDSYSDSPSISADGATVIFRSRATNLVAGDTNGADDIFVRGPPPPPHAYCTSGVTTNGCTASTAASANPSVAHSSACNITIANVEGLKSGILFYGIDNAGFTPAIWAFGSTSYVCVKGPWQRTAIQDSGGTLGACDGSFALDWNAYQLANPLALGNPWSIGDKVYVQAWFRDPLAVKATNLSNALELTYVP
jgi:Tol biopolymer transport system component